MLRFVGVQPEDPRGGRGGGKHPGSALGVKSGHEQSLSGGRPDPQSHLVAGGRSAQQLAARDLSLGFGQRQRRREHQRSAMDDGVTVNVVHLKTVACGGVDKSGTRRGKLASGSENGGLRSSAVSLDLLA